MEAQIICELTYALSWNRAEGRSSGMFLIKIGKPSLAAFTIFRSKSQYITLKMNEKWIVKIFIFYKANIDFVRQNYFTSKMY